MAVLVHELPTRSATVNQLQMPGERRQRAMELPDPGHDLIAETRAVEHAVMTDLVLLVVRFPCLRNAAAEILRRRCLAKPGDVVEFSFDGEEACVADGPKINWGTPVLHLTLGQRVFDKNRIDGLQVEFRWQIHDRAVLVVELAVLSR